MKRKQNDPGAFKAHVKKGGRDRNDEGGTDKSDDNYDVEAHVKSYKT